MSDDTEIHLHDDSMRAAGPKKLRNPDSELHLDDEKDSLYSDGLEVENESETLAGTHRNVNPG